MDQDWTTVERDYRNYLRTSGKSEATARTYISAVSLFWRWCSARETDIRDVDRSTVRTWIAERLERVSAVKCHNNIAGLRLFFAMLREDHWRDDDPTANISVKRTKTAPTPPLEDFDLDAMLHACTNERDRLILLVMDATGMRISEVAGLCTEDIDWRKGTITVTGKGQKVRLIEPSPEVMGRLHAFLGMFPSGPLWLSQRQHRQLSAHQIRKVLYEVAGRAKVSGFHPHEMRARFATKYIDQYGDIQALQGVMGHESIETTARYSESTRERRGRVQTRGLRLLSTG